MRYRMIPVPEMQSNFSLIIDKLHICPDYRGKKYSWMTLLSLFKLLIQSNVFVQQILIILPSNSWIEAKSFQTGFQRIPESPLCTYNNSVDSLLFLRVESVQTLYDITTFLQSKPTTVI
jgi:hypothetical protein